jgi:REP element-mobilizing transposase RayT
MFELFDPKQDYVVRQGTLPHWYQPGVTYFVTFRTEDSVPQPRLRSWHRPRDEWLSRHGIDPIRANWKSLLAADPDLDREYHARFTRAFMGYLDRGYGACELRTRESAEIVANALRHFNGDRYELDEFVVMPNHVHVLVCLLGDTEIEAQCYSWKKFSAGEINRLLGSCGRFWQEESFDHLVRSVEQYEYLQQYIAENPIKAGLRNGEYLYWKRPM